jgi:hypothetical protein
VRHGSPGRLAWADADPGRRKVRTTLGFIQIVGGWGVIRRISAWSRGLDHYAMLLVMVTILTYSLQPFTFAVLSDSVHNRDDFVAAIRLLAILLTVSMIAFSSLTVYLRRRGLFRTEVLDPRLFEIAYRLGTTVWVWPLVTLVLTFVIGPYALAPIVIFMILSLMPIEALPAEQDETAEALD